MKFNSKVEWQQFLINKLDDFSGIYGLVRHSDIEEIIYFRKFRFDGDTFILEFPNYLRAYENITEEHLKPYYDEEENEWHESTFKYMTIIDTTAYEIDSPQTSPFLPDEIEIVKFYTEDEEEEVVKQLIHNQLKS